MYGGDGNDVLNGGSFVDTIFGGSGNDIVLLVGGDFLDQIDGGTGTDTIDASGYTTLGFFANLQTGQVGSTSTSSPQTISSIENVIGTANADTIIGSSAVNIIDAGAGDDTIGTGSSGLVAGDSFGGGAGIDTLDISGLFNSYAVNLATGVFDTVTGGFASTVSGIENVMGGNGNDVITGNSDANTLYGGNGNDSIFGGGGLDELYGGEGNDYLDGGSDSESLFGGGGDDRFFIGLFEGNDDIYGGTGVDTLDLSALTAFALLIDLNGGTWNFGDAADIENAIGSSGNDTITGSAAANVIDGGAGMDTASYISSSAGVTVRLWNGTGVGGTAEGDTLSNIEHLIGTTHDDNLLGSFGVANSLQGSLGNDYLNGYSGDDFLFGGDGRDNLEGGTGADYLNGGAGLSDTASYTASTSGVTVRLWNGTGSGGEAQGDTLVDIENLIGSVHNDVFIGADGVNNVFQSGAGDDYLAGLGGNDQFYGGVGADQFDGGTGTDTVIYAQSGAGVTARLWNGTASGGEATGDSLTSIENLFGSAHNDVLVGSNGVNALIGLAGNDVIFGLDGNDRLDGSGGNDTMEGGAGTDFFLFGANYGQDRVTDFTNGTDYVDLIGGLVFANLTLSAIAGGVRASISAAPAHWIDLMGVTLGDISSSDFV